MGVVEGSFPITAMAYKGSRQPWLGNLEQHETT